MHKFDFLPEEYSELGGNIFVPNGLYKQCVSMKNEKLWFIGMQNVVYSSSMFQLQEIWNNKILRIQSKFIIFENIVNKFRGTF